MTYRGVVRKDCALFYMDETDSFALNIAGVANLIGDDTNKVRDNGNPEEGVEGDFEDVLDLPMADSELLELKEQWETKSNGYLPKVKARQDRNKAYYRGVQRNLTTQIDTVIPSNLLFEAEETFIPQSLSQNPEPVVFSDNTDEGKQASNDLKTMLQYHADVLAMRKKLAMMVRHWSIYFLGVVKHGWDTETNDIKTEIRKPQNFILDPDGYVDEFGDFKGAFLGERIESTAERLIEMFPSSKDYITLKVNAKLGTSVIRTEWWTDKYCFTTFQDEVLDKHKNEYFNYEKKEKGTDEFGLPTQTITPAINHFAIPKMPYTFLSVFSLQEQPYDITNLIEQNIANQDRITDRDAQIDKNLASANNSVILSGQAFTVETASQAVQSFYEEGFLLVPNGDVDGAVKRIPANEIPSSVFTAQDNDKNTLRSVFGTQGLTPSTEPDQRVRNNIMNEQHDSTRIGGGVGDALEQVAKNIFSWWAQLYCVFYDELHYGAVMGNARAVEYVTMLNTNLIRKFVISVSPNSMKPKDEISETNQAIELANTGWLDPINLFKALDDPDPMNTAKMVTMWKTNPQQYALTYFPESQLQTQGANAPNPLDLQAQEGAPEPNISAPPASPALSQVPLKSPLQLPNI